MPEPAPPTSRSPAGESKTSLGAQLEQARPILLANGWVTPGQLDTLNHRAMGNPPVTPLAGRSPLAQFLVDLHILSREQANELDTIGQVQRSMPDFHLLRKLGSGGMGTVFLARHLKRDAMVALKTINARLAQEEDFVSRFHREASSIIEVVHPNIARIMATGESKDGICWLAMEYIDGPSLMHLLREHRVLPEAYALQVCRQIAQGLGHVWRTSELVHRDIKPENILVIRSRAGDELFPLTDVAKLIDFGLVKSNLDDERLTQTGMTIGTPLYMSPEQVRGEKLDCRSDIYGLGATLYHLLTGVTPFTGSSPGTIMSAHLTQPVPDPADKVPSLCSQTRELVRISMAKSPKDRFLTFEAFEQACAAALSHLTSSGQTGPRLLRKPMVLKTAVRRSGEIRVDDHQAQQLTATPPATALQREPSQDNSRRNPSRPTGAEPMPGTGPIASAHPGTGQIPPHRPGTEAINPTPDTTLPTGTALEPRRSPVPTTAKRERDLTHSAAFHEPPPSQGIGIAPWLVFGGAVAVLVVYLLLS